MEPNLARSNIKVITSHPSYLEVDLVLLTGHVTCHDV